MFVGLDSGSGDKNVVSMWDGRGFTVVEPPEWAGDVVSITEFQGVLLVACKRAVFRMRDGVLYPLKFAEQES